MPPPWRARTSARGRPAGTARSPDSSRSPAGTSTCSTSSLPCAVATAGTSIPVGVDTSAARRGPERLSGDDHLLDLARALVDAEEPGITEEALDRDAAHVSGPAVHLDGPVGDAAD